MADDRSRTLLPREGKIHTAHSFRIRMGEQGRVNESLVVDELVHLS